jgi:tRNA-dihydrouridine synthase B
MNLFLPAEIKGKTYSSADKKLMLKTFHQRVFEEYSVKLDNQGNVLNKMKQFWIYFSSNFPDNEKVLKRIKKANSVFIYKAEVGSIFNALM